MSWEAQDFSGEGERSNPRPAKSFLRRKSMRLDTLESVSYQVSDGAGDGDRLIVRGLLVGVSKTKFIQIPRQVYS